MNGSFKNNKANKARKRSQMRIILKCVLLFLVGYVIGAAIATAIFDIANAQSRTNQTVTLTTTNSVVLRGVIDDTSVLDTELKLVTQNIKRGRAAYPIYLVLDSPGGDIDSGLSLIEFAKSMRNLHTVSIFAASMASAVAEALPGERLVTQNGIMMFHRAAGTFRGYFETGEVESELWVSKAMVRQMENTNSSRMRMPVQSYKNLAQNELWLFGDLAVTYRAADRVVDLLCTNELINKTETTVVQSIFSLFGGGGTTTLKFSGCPLLRAAQVDSENAKYLVPSVRNYKTFELLKIKDAVSGK